MAKSGRQRKSKRKARQKAEKQLPEVWRPSSEEEAKQNNALVKRYARWNTDAVERDDLDMSELDFRALPAKTIAMLVTRRNMLSFDPNVSNAAVRNLLTMEHQNQQDEKQLEPTPHLHIHASSLQQGPYAAHSDDEIIDAKLAIDGQRSNGNGQTK